MSEETGKEEEEAKRQQEMEKMMRDGMNDALKRLTKRGRMELACLMDASKGSISGLDSMIANLRAMRHRCGNQIESDQKEIVEIDKNIARLSASQKKYGEPSSCILVTSLRRCATRKRENEKERDLMQHSLKHAVGALTASSPRPLLILGGRHCDRIGP